ncbi:MAG: DEAD/DEAH box helicase [Thermoplasmata archaeon]|nr:DEAD/DEAH box helicase [Thermoplasmata archaeon]
MPGRSRSSPPPKGAVRAPTSIVPLADLPIDADLRRVLEADGIRALYPPQAAALGPVMAGESLLLACPTASGKSLVAYLALLRATRAHRTGLYLVPLRALAQEKAEELERFAELGLKVGLSTGDFDLSAEKLDRLDVLVATSEKADGLLRRGSPWLDRLGVVVADEVHLLRDPERGPTLEVSLTRLRRKYPDLQVVALSATVGNSTEVADWLGARHIASDFRPVPLQLGVYSDGRILFTDLSHREIAPPGEAIPRLVRTVIEDGGQALVFVNSRRASEQVAEALVPTVRSLLTPAERVRAKEWTVELGGASDEDTQGMRRLTGLIPYGVAFHNASLTNPERRIVEKAFRERTLKVLVATPTLAAGINLPARRVIVRDTSRYEGRIGMQAPIPAGEIHQMLGRAGRPRFDVSGEALLLARSAEEEERLLDDYLSAPPEDVVSRLAAEPALRMHVLALVASGAVRSEAELTSFFAATFYGRTLPLIELETKVRNVRRFLEENDFLTPGARLEATRFGRLTSDLYLDPLTAVVLRQVLERAPIGVKPFALLAAVATTPDLPPLYLRRDDEADLMVRFTDELEEILVKPDEAPLHLDLDGILASLKTASVLEAWIDEVPIVELTERWGIGAGDLRTKVEDAEWLLYAAGRLAATFQRRLGRAIDDLATRVRYGAREELLDLVRMRGIGRVRSRMLYRAGFADREALRRAPADRIAVALHSRTLADLVLSQLGRKGEVGATGESTLASPVPAAPKGRKPKVRRLDEYPAEGPS